VADDARHQAAYEPRTPWTAGSALLATLMIYGAGVLALSGALSLDNVLRGVGRAQGLWRQDMSTLLTIGVWQLVTIALTFAAAGLFGGKVCEVLSLQAPTDGTRTYVIAAALTVFLQTAVWLLALWLAREGPSNQPPSTRLFGEQWWLALLVIGIGAPFAEELLFRGFLQSALSATRLGFWGAAIITGTWWTVLHAGPSLAAFLSVFVMGLLYAWQLRWSGSLRVPIFCHALYNIVIILVFGQLKL